MERIRLGLTGLGLIVLIVFAGSGGLRTGDGALAEADTPKKGETLSVLGVAPKAEEKAPAVVTLRPPPPMLEAPAQDLSGAR